MGFLTLVDGSAYIGLFKNGRKHGKVSCTFRRLRRNPHIGVLSQPRFRSVGCVLAGPHRVR